MGIKFKSYSSGSCGNCYFLGIEEDGAIVAGIVIDAGISLRRLKREMAVDGLSTDDFSALLITHDHFDHIRSLGSFCKHLGKPVYATKKLHYALAHNTFTFEYMGGVRKDFLEDDWTEVVPGYIKVRPFEVPHDATQTVGFCILLKDYVFVIATDAGEFTAEAMEYAMNASTVVIESNYDDYMLDHGSYTEQLKARIRGGNGHLSNALCAKAINEFGKGEKLRNVFLCHISENNNTPSCAHECARKALDELGRQDVRLVALPRQTPSKLFNL